jgi:hypothetical protein
MTLSEKQFKSKRTRGMGVASVVKYLSNKYTILSSILNITKKIFLKDYRAQINPELGVQKIYLNVTSVKGKARRQKCIVIGLR